MAGNGTFGKISFSPENTPGLFGDYPGGIGGDSGMSTERLKIIGDYRKILRGNYGISSGILNKKASKTLYSKIPFENPCFSYLNIVFRKMHPQKIDYQQVWLERYSGTKNSYFR